MPAPIVSVNTCAYNASTFVVETLRSVLAQTLQDFEVVIVDDGSTDGTPDLIEATFPDPRIRVIRQHHVTLRYARSIALAHSAGEFIAFLDADDCWYPEKLERQVAAARALREPALIFCDADLIDASSRRIGRFSDQFHYRAMDFRGTNGHVELLRRGNFIASPTPFAAAATIRAAGAFNLAFRHVNDYELWLRLARRHPLRFIDEPLALYRVHHTQFTQRRMDVTLPEQCALLHPIMRSASYPPQIRTAIGDNLLGQHRLAYQTFRADRRPWLAARAAAGMLRYPDRLFDSLRHRLSGRPAGGLLDGATAGFLRGADLLARVRARTVNLGHQAIARARRAPGRLARALGGGTRPASSAAATATTHVWMDGTCLSRDQAGYFNLLVELIRRLADRGDCLVHVRTTAAGRAALASRVAADPSRIAFHPCGWRALHWSQIHAMAASTAGQLALAWVTLALLALSLAAGFIPGAFLALALAMGHALVLADDLTSRWREASGRSRERWLARAIRFAWRRLPRPRGRTPTPNTIEVLFWRGRFHWRDSRRVAFVQDMTTRLHPEWHTPGNVREFEEFLGYAQRHAQAIATVSACSRVDIVDRIAVAPDAVSVIPMPIHPQYAQPSFSRGWLTLHRIASPYILSVGTIEPRKNLRRLIKAFEWLSESDTLRDHQLVLVGPPGWDDRFDEFLAGSDVASRVIRLGYVPLDHLPSLYHYAAAVVQPSLYEGFGIPVMEAMCCSAIVLASRAGSLPGVLGDAGLLFDPYDSRAIASALLATLTLAPDEAAAYRRRCRARAEAHLQRLATEPLIPGLPPSSAVHPHAS